MDGTEPFRFFTERRLVVLTGRKARNLPELLAALEDVPGSCIFYHTHHLFLSHHFEKPVVYNEFATWVGESLQEDALAEQLAAIDLLRFTSVRQLREAIIAPVAARLERKNQPLRECPPGEEFHFGRSKSFILPTGIVAADIPDFFAKLARVTNASLYFHFLEARLRLERRTNDFSYWLEGRGAPELARAIDELNPYILTLDELKADMIDLGSRYGSNPQ